MNNMSEAIGKIAKKIFEINEEGKYTAFFNFSGHCHLLEIKLYIGKWKPETNPIYEKRVYSDWNINLDSVYDELIKFVERGE